jgi:Na+-translocating ferredoxin:NAD+ oxidoreductase RnfG subunit
MSSISASGTSSRPRGWLQGLLAAALLVGCPTSGVAKVFFSRSEALELAFAGADRVESETFVLDDEQIQRIEKLARSEVDTKLIKVYTGYRSGEVVGYAVIDIHRVRTLPEAFMVVLNPEGTVRSLRVLAFHEPLDYLPSDRWYDQFGEKALDEQIQLGGDVHGVIGATLSARATTRGVRRVLAYYEVLIQEGH